MEPAQVDELVHLYQRVSGHLGHARAAYGDPALDARLSQLVAEANAVIYGTRSSARRAISTFVFATFPGAVWRIRRFVLAATIITFLPAIVAGVWIANSDAALEASGDAAVRAAYVEDDFESYYSSQPASEFAAKVTFNNIQVSITAFAVGIAGSIGAAALLAFNGANVGVAAGLFYAVGEPAKFWGLILPHGLLELTAVVLAGAAGLRLGWALIDPGDRSRGRAIAEEGRTSVTVILGLVAVFITAGLIEGFITGSGLPTPVRVGVGVIVEVAFVTYLYRFGRSAEAAQAAAAVA